jgi:hypothetical protein
LVAAPYRACIRCRSSSSNVGLNECVTAGLFYFQEILGLQRIDPALVEMPSVDTAGIHIAGIIFRLLDQEGTPKQDLAAGATTGAFSLPKGEELLIFICVDAGSEKTPHLSCGLPRAQAKSSCGRGQGGAVRGKLHE